MLWSSSRLSSSPFGLDSGPTGSTESNNRCCIIFLPSPKAFAFLDRVAGFFGDGAFFFGGDGVFCPPFFFRGERRFFAFGGDGCASAAASGFNPRANISSLLRPSLHFSTREAWSPFARPNSTNAAAIFTCMMPSSMLPYRSPFSHFSIINSARTRYASKFNRGFLICFDAGDGAGACDAILKWLAG